MGERVPDSDLPDNIVPDSDLPDELRSTTPTQDFVADATSKPAIGDSVGNQVHAMASGLYHNVVGGYKGLGTLIATRDPNKAADTVNAETAKTYQAPDSGVKTVMESKWNPLNYAQEGADWAADKSADLGASPGVSTAIKAAPTAVGALVGAGNLFRKAPISRVPAQSVADQAAARNSTGAAATAPDVTQASAPIQQAISAADPTKVDMTAMNNHLEADRHGVQLMKGAANRDPVQYSEEQNQSTHPLIAQRINENNQQMADAFDNIRRDASPTTVSNNSRENGQAVVDSLKAYDEPVQADIKAKYKALTDANGGNLPIDPGSFLSNVDSQLKKGFLTSTAAATPEISDILKSVRAGEPMDFESFENARSRLASAQRAGGSAGEAARIVRGQLEQMPLSPDAANLKGLANEARSAAKARFGALEQDPAYQAAVDDVSGGIKKGAPSPLADTFLDNYAISKSAPKSQVDLMMSKLDPDARGAVASHTLNTIRKTAINTNGNVLPAGYHGPIKKFDESGKLSSLVSPETEENVRSLGNVINNVKTAPPGSSIAPKSGVIVRDAITGGLEHAASTVFPKTMGAYGILKKIMPKDGFAKEATKPGAGIESDTIQRPQRARGGKVDHEELLNRLMARWKAAKKDADNTTKPLLGVSDATITKALDIAGSAI
jgi:hypothetical protein